LLHELGHGYAVKAFGGRIYEIGVMFLVFAPMPYVDASSASEFRSKWRRALVGAAGMLVEVFIAALALYTWLVVEPGLVRATAYNIIVVAGVSTVVFNGNPLLRYDGYYILADILEIPNLGQRSSRYWGHIVEKYLFWMDTPTDFEADRHEKFWFLLYAPAAYVYRLFVVFSIALFVASEYLALGALIAIWGIAMGVGLPLWKALSQVFVGPRFQRNRGRAVAVTSSLALLAALSLCLVPAPLFTTAEGIVWLPETANVRAGTGAFVQRTLATPGQLVRSGQALFESEEITITATIDVLRSQVSELEARLAAERFADRVKAELTRTELGQVHSELAVATIRAERMIARSRAEGTFWSANHQDLVGRYVKEGHLLGHVLPEGSKIIRTTVQQQDIDLVRNRLRRIEVKLAERSDATLAARLLREVPAGSEELPSKALGGAAGGALPVDPRDPHGTKTLQRVFQFDVELLSSEIPIAFGSRAHVRFEHQWEPLGQQIWRRVRQLVLSRLYA
jgi:putative peptide zinc metalloprotease protein